MLLIHHVAISCGYDLIYGCAILEAIHLYIIPPSVFILTPIYSHPFVAFTFKF